MTGSKQNCEAKDNVITKIKQEVQRAKQHKERGFDSKQEVN